jgi:hypothetical protein
MDTAGRFFRDETCLSCRCEDRHREPHFFRDDTSLSCRCEALRSNLRGCSRAGMRELLEMVENRRVSLFLPSTNGATNTRMAKFAIRVFVAPFVDGGKSAPNFDILLMSIKKVRSKYDRTLHSRFVLTASGSSRWRSCPSAAADRAGAVLPSPCRPHRRPSRRTGWQSSRPLHPALPPAVNRR